MPAFAKLRRHPYAALAALALVAGLALVLVLGLRPRLTAAPGGALVSVALTPDKPPPPPPPRLHEKAQKAPSGGAPPPAPVAAPLPHLVLAPPIAIVLPVTASGDGQGSGGQGSNGSGGGRGNGNGSGNGDGGMAAPAEQISGHLSPRDLPPGTIPPGGQLSVGVSYTVGIDGRVQDCATPRSSGNPAIDARVCELLVKRFRYRPARAADGTPVASTVRETHSWARRPES